MASNLSADQLQKSKFFIYKKGRLLDRKLYEYFYENGTKQACLKALSAYQNEDGGFGNGIEPDLLCPDSTAIGAETAMVMLDLIDCANTEVAHRLVDWIITHQNADGYIPHPPENLYNYPYQPWWKNPDKERILSLAGMMMKWSLDRPDFFEKVRNCYLDLPFPSELEFYNYPFFIYLKYCSVSDQDRARFSTIVDRLPALLLKFSSHFPLYSRYWSFARNYVDQDILEREKANFINALQEDGGIVTAYPDFPWWDPIFLLDGLIELKRWS
jgi:hypothetical protein